MRQVLFPHYYGSGIFFSLLTFLLTRVGSIEQLDRPVSLTTETYSVIITHIRVCALGPGSYPRTKNSIFVRRRLVCEKGWKLIIRLGTAFGWSWFKNSFLVGPRNHDENQIHE